MPTFLNGLKRFNTYRETTYLRRIRLRRNCLYRNSIKRHPCVRLIASNCSLFTSVSSARQCSGSNCQRDCSRVCRAPAIAELLFATFFCSASGRRHRAHKSHAIQINSHYTQLNLTPSSLEKQLLQWSFWLRTRTSAPLTPSPSCIRHTQHLKQSKW